MSMQNLCANATCNGVCVGSNTSETCVEKNVYMTCYSPIGAVVMAIIAMLPNLLSLIVASFSCCKRPPVFSALYNLIINFMYACLVHMLMCFSEKSFDIYAFIFATMFTFHIIFYPLFINDCFGDQKKCCRKIDVNNDDLVNAHNQFNQKSEDGESTCATGCCCCQTGQCCDPNRGQRRYGTCPCCKGPNSPAGILHEIRAPSMSKEDLGAVVTENAMLPPTIEYHGVAYHEVHTKNGTHLEPKCTKVEEMRYRTWQEEGDPIVIPDASVIMLYADSSCQIGKDALGAAEDVKQLALNEVVNKDRLATVYPKHRVVGFVEFAVGHDNHGCVKFIKSSGGIFLYYFLMFFGYHSIYDSIWRSLGEPLHFHSKKVVSIQDIYRGRYGERDRAVSDRIIRYNLA